MLDDFKKASGSMIKNMNISKILKIINGRDFVSRADIAKELNMSKSAVSSIIDELISKGYVKEGEMGKSNVNGGRRPINLAFNKDLYNIIGINVTGYSVSAILTDLCGNIISRRSFSITGRDIIKELIGLINEMKRKNTLGVGIGIPGIVDIEKSKVVYSPALKWNDVFIGDIISRQTGCKVYAENNIKAASLGEKWKGIAKESSDFVYVSVERGIACGIIINNNLYHGNAYTAGEIGYMVLGRRVKDSFTLNDFGSFELEAANHAMVRNAINLIQDYPDSYLNQITGGERGRIRPKMVFDGYEKGDALCSKVIDEYIDIIAMGIANIVALLNPEKIILGGDLYFAGEHATKKLKDLMEKLVPVQVTVEKSILHEYAGSLGAVALVLQGNDILRGVL